jgi:cyclopropane-fatty-acyl-phospholipid synthase
MFGFLSARVARDFLDTCAGITEGRLRVITPDGQIHDFGSGAPEAELHLRDWSAVTATLARGDIGLGETYVAGLWDSPSIEALSTVALRNFDRLNRYVFGGFWHGLRFRLVHRLLRANSRRGAGRNIRAHYDVGNEFYQLWLDDSMTYSAGLYAPDDDDLGHAQARKHDRILDRVGTGERLLEIGCGWGGFAERAAERGHAVTGMTISPNQKAYADARLDGRADIRLQDYRDALDTYDSIVSIEMVEAVGERYWPVYFASLRDRLRPGGRAVLQAITVQDGYFDTYRRGSDFIRHYTFPGGMLLSNQVIADQARQAGLSLRDSFAFGGDYARTCRQWSQRLDAQRARLHRLGFDEGFLRSWRYYLQTCAASFATGHTDVVQVELAHA